MKVVNVFAHVFSICAFLTLGSLLLIVSLKLLSLDEAVLRLKEIYASPWKSFEFGIMGLAFITVGLVFARILIKKGKETDVLIYRTEAGPILVSGGAMEDIAKKVLRRFSLVKDSKIKVLINGKNVDFRVRLILWSGGHVQQLLLDIQREIRIRVIKLIGEDCHLELSCDVIGVEEHHQQLHDYENDKVPA